jgi:hypothetical protein
MRETRNTHGKAPVLATTACTLPLKPGLEAVGKDRVITQAYEIDEGENSDRSEADRKPKA